MITITQVLIPIALLSSVVFAVPLTKDDREVKDVANRIYGGEQAWIGQFPHHVSLRVRLGPIFVHMCGGSIITERFVLTSGICFWIRYPPQNYRVVVGAHVNNVTDGTPYNVSRYIVHERFYVNETGINVRNNIALIETASTIEFNRLVRPIRLHSRFIGEATGAVVSGWNSTVS